MSEATQGAGANQTAPLVAEKRPERAALSFFVPSQPVAKGRARSTAAGGRVRHYTPAKTRNAEQHVRFLAMEAMDGAALFDGPINLSLSFVIDPPGSWSEKRRQEAFAGLIRATKKPDLDNLEKLIKDACSKVVWRDDAQVVDVHKRKDYGMTPGVYVDVTRATGRAAP